MQAPSKQPRKWTKKRTLIALYSLAALIAASLLIWDGVIIGTGFGTKQVWDWLQLLIIPAVLASAALWFNWQQSKVEREIGEQRRKADIEIAEQHRKADLEIAEQHRKADLEIAEQRRKVDLDIAADQQRESILQAYLDRMSELLLDKKLSAPDSQEETRKVARVRTLTVLRRLDPNRKAAVVKFLHEAGLLTTKNPIISLSQADLKHIILTSSLLKEINLSGAYLHQAKLNYTDLSSSDLSYAELNGADLQGAELVGTDMSSTWLFGANLNRAELNEAILRGSLLRDADVSDADLSNADLTDTLWLQDVQLAKAKSLKGTIMPNGSKHD